MNIPSPPYQPYASVHKDPQGPGDARPTAHQILEDCNAISNLANKSILITGASSGIGIATAKAFYKTGAQLYLTARDVPKMEQIIDDIVAPGARHIHDQSQSKCTWSLSPVSGKQPVS
jgi:NADPH:quinone reductase-like Zn-dependent oxidoreductase